jgi:hypothetical protein
MILYIYSLSGLSAPAVAVIVYGNAQVDCVQHLSESFGRLDSTIFPFTFANLHFKASIALSL